MPFSSLAGASDRHMTQIRFSPFLAGALALGLAACQSGPLTEYKASSDVMVVAHRGCPHEAPENSLPAILACEGLGVAIVETDVRLLGDGTPVILHDATLDRMTDGTGPVTALKWEEFSGLSLLSGHGGPGAEMTSLHPPGLADLLDTAPPEMMLNLDVKDAAAYPAVIGMLVEKGSGQSIILKSAMAPDHPEFAAFLGNGTRFMPVIRQCTPGQISTPDLYCADTPQQILADFDGLDLFGYELIFYEEQFLSAFSAALGRTDKEIWVNALAPEHAAGHTDALALADPDAHWGRLIELGATIIQTDYPAELRAYIEARTAPTPAQP